MKINEMIRKLRLENNLTQEQVANYLGVTAPAVNKWEKGTSYPDITLLPALARLLDTDLNTLLSFQEDLTKQEVTMLLNQASEVMEQEGFEAGYSFVMRKLKEYPTCDSLILGMAMLLDGAWMICGNTEEYAETYKAQIESLYARAAKGKNAAVVAQAQEILISKRIERGEFEEAQKLLLAMPDESPVDKKQIQAKLLRAQGKTAEAAKLTEEKLLSAVYGIHTVMLTLMETAIQENRMEDAQYIADVYRESAKIFDLWEYNSYLAHFELYSASKQRVKCLKVLIPMLKSLARKWHLNESPLYRHIHCKDDGDGKKLQKMLMQLILADREASFLKDSPELQEFIAELNPSES